MKYDDSEPLLTPKEWLKEIEDTSVGEPIPTILDPFIPHFVKGRTTVLGADTEVGKTVFGIQQFVHAVNMGVPSAYVTLEMTPGDLFVRMLPQFDNDEDKLKDWIVDNRAYVSKPYIDAHEIEQIIKNGFDFVVVDHIHELPFDGHEDLARKVKRLASLAPATNTSLLLLSQMKRPDFFAGMPTKHDFSWSKAIAEVASVALALYREEDDGDEVLLLNLKNRFGAKFDPLKLRLDSSTVTFVKN